MHEIILGVVVVLFIVLLIADYSLSHRMRHIKNEVAELKSRIGLLSADFLERTSIDVPTKIDGLHAYSVTGDTLYFEHPRVTIRKALELLLDEYGMEFQFEMEKEGCFKLVDKTE